MVRGVDGVVRVWGSDDGMLKGSWKAHRGYVSTLELSPDGQRLVIYMAAPGTPDYDAMVLLDMAGFAGATPDGSSHGSGLSHPR